MRNSAVLRSNFDFCCWKNCDGSSSNDLNGINCRSECQTGLARIVMKLCDASFDMSCSVMFKDILGCRDWQTQI